MSVRNKTSEYYLFIYLFIQINCFLLPTLIIIMLLTTIASSRACMTDFSWLHGHILRNALAKSQNPVTLFCCPCNSADYSLSALLQGGTPQSNRYLVFCCLRFTNCSSCLQFFVYTHLILLIRDLYHSNMLCRDHL